MENASNALIIAGSVLIAIIILSIGVLLFSTYTKVGESYEQTQTTEAVAKFNSKFTIFEERTDITAQEIVSIHNFVKEYNQENNSNINIVYPAGITSIDIEFIKNNSVDNQGKTIYFKCIGDNCIEYDDKGRVSKITFTK